MKLKLFPLLIVTVILLAACGSAATPTPSEPTPDVAAVRTSAASTVVSQFTLTAAAFTPTLPPPPTETTAPEPTVTATQPAIAQVTNPAGTTIVICDKYSWDITTLDVNIPDNTPMTPGQDFTKTWKIKNTGSCPWGEGYSMIYSYGDKMSGQAQPLSGVISPGEEVDVSVNFTAPNLAGTYFSFWTMANTKGVPFLGNEDKALYVQIIVQ
jgi:hypothetical protein